MKHIDIVIINWNAGNLLAEAVASILQSNYDLDNVSILVIDNASSDNSLKLLPSHSSLKVIQNKENKGFAYACNQGYAIGRGEYLLLLNPDTRLFEDTLIQSVEFMEKRKEISVLGVKHVDDNGKVHPSCSHFPSAVDFLILALGLYQLFPKLFRSPIIMMEYDYEKEGEVDQVMGAYMFMRRSDIEKFKMKMDQRFFVYYEDLDFSKSLSKNGCKSFYSPSISIVHKVNGTTDQIKAKRLFYSTRSRLLYCKKHFNIFNYLLIVFFSLIVEPFTRIFHLLIKGKQSELRKVVEGYRMIFSNFFGYFMK